MEMKLNLIRKLEEYGICGIVEAWFSPYNFK